MISSSLQLALRHAIKFKTYSFIKIGGLALGFASSIAILHFVCGEFSYDKFHRLSDNVYRLNTITQTPTGVQVQAAGTPLLAPTLMSDIPEVEAAVRLRHADDVLVEIGEKKFHETKVFYADSNFFKVLTFPLAKGNPNTALKEINTAVITTELAEKYFGNQDPINKTIKVNNLLVEVRGVTLPTGKSHFEFDILISFETFTPPKGVPVSMTSWAWTSFPTYVRLRQGSEVVNVEKKFPALINKYRPPEDGRKVNYQLQPIKEVYLHSRDILERDGISTKGDYTYTIGLAAIAALSLHCVFQFCQHVYRPLHLSCEKKRESSGHWVQVSRKFFPNLSSNLYSTLQLALLLGLVILQAAISKLENLLDMDWSLTAITHFKSLPLYIVLVITVGFIGGLYPAIFLSGLKPQLA